MPKWSRYQRRRYKEERQAKAALVAARLRGVKRLESDFSFSWPQGKPLVNYDWVYMNSMMNVSQPRLSAIITGIEGV